MLTCGLVGSVITVCGCTVRKATLSSQIKGTTSHLLLLFVIHAIDSLWFCKPDPLFEDKDHVNMSFTSKIVYFYELWIITVSFVIKYSVTSYSTAQLLCFGPTWAAKWHFKSLFGGDFFSVFEKWPKALWYAQAQENPQCCSREVPAESQPGTCYQSSGPACLYQGWHFHHVNRELNLVTTSVFSKRNVQDNFMLNK